MVYAFSDEAAEGVGVVTGLAVAAVVAPGLGAAVVAFCADATAIMPRRRTKTCKQKRGTDTESDKDGRSRQHKSAQANLKEVASHVLIP
jgi:hypothetical protein